MIVPHATYAIPNGYTMSNSSKLKARKELSWSELRDCIVNKGMVYEEVNAIYPISKSKYNAMLKEAGYNNDSVRIRERREAEMIRMYNEGHSIEEIAAANHILPGTCKNKLESMGISLRNKGNLDKYKDEIIDLLSKDWTPKTLANKYNVSLKEMNKYLQSIGEQTLKQKAHEFLETLTASKIESLLNIYGNVRKVSLAKGISVSSLVKRAQKLNVKI